MVEQQNRQERDIRVLAGYTAALLLPLLTGLAMYKVKGIAPFGDQCILNMDLWGQYFPMYVQQAKASSLRELLYSYNGGLGYNNLAQSAYYTNSILLLILRFFPVSSMVLVLDWICVVKLSLSSAACLAFLRRKTGGSLPLLVAGAYVYSLCAYALAFYTQPMWTDTLWYAPLVLIGLDRLIFERKSVFYSLILALCIMSSFYIGFAVCLFSVCYFLSELCFLPKGKAAAAGRFFVYSLLAGGLAAFIILPVGLAIFKTIASDIPAPDHIAWYAGWREYLSMLLPQQKLKLQYSGVNIFTGLLVFILLPLYFFNRRISLGEKTAHGLFTAFLFLSMNCNVLDYAWHGFHFPNQLPGRWTFLFSLLLVWLMTKGLSAWEGITPAAGFFSLLAGWIFLLLAAAGLKGDGALAPLGLFPGRGMNPWSFMGECVDILQENIPGIYLALYAMAGAGIVLLSLHAFMRFLLPLGLGLVLAANMAGSGISFVRTAAMEEGGFHTSGIEGYSRTVDKFRRFGDAWGSSGDDFYRIEENPGYTFNPSMLTGQPGLSYYSSTMQAEVYDFMAYLGNRVYAKNVSSVYNISSPVMNGIFGVRYFFDFGFNLPANLGGAYREVAREEEGVIYENPTALPFAYAVSDKVLALDSRNNGRSLSNQNDFLSLLMGDKREVYQKLYTSSFGYDNCHLQESADWNSNYFLREDQSKPVVIYYSYTLEEDGPIYLENNYRKGTLSLSWEGGSREIKTGEVKYYFLGDFAAGTKIDISFTVDDVNIGCCGLNLYRFDTAGWEEAYRTLSSCGMSVEKAEPGLVAGRIEMETDGLVLATVSQDGGWNLFCDGERVETGMAGCLLTAMIPKGNHFLEWRYHVPGLSAGTGISLLCLAMLLLQKRSFAGRLRRHP